MPDLLSCAVCGGTLKPRQRRCCSRRCALRAGFSPRSLTARDHLQRLLSRVPRHIRDGSIQRLRTYMQVHDAAAKALHRRAGWRVCEVWAEELRKAAS